MIETLMERRQKILSHFLNQVTPLEFMNYSNNRLTLKDMSRILINEDGKKRSYFVHFYDDHGKELSHSFRIYSDSSIVTIPVKQTQIYKADGYLRIDVVVADNNHSDVPPAQFHFSQEDDASLRFVGVVH